MGPSRYMTEGYEKDKKQVLIIGNKGEEGIKMILAATGQWGGLGDGFALKHKSMRTSAEDINSLKTGSILAQPSGRARIPSQNTNETSSLLSVLCLFRHLPTRVWSVAWGNWLSSSKSASSPRGFWRNMSRSGRLSSYTTGVTSMPSFWYSIWRNTDCESLQPETGLCSTRLLRCALLCLAMLTVCGK